MTAATWKNTRSWNFETAEAKAAREVAEMAAWQIKNKAAREAERVARVKRELPIFSGIAHALHGKCVAGEVILDTEALTITVKGVRVSGRIDIRQEWSGGSAWRSRPNGKTRVTVGNFGDRTSYPQRKDGTYNYEAIAEKLLSHAEHELARDRAEAARKANLSVVPALRQEYGFKYEYSGQGSADVQLQPSSTVDRPVQLSFKYNCNVTVERAREIMNGLKALGLM